MNTADRDLLKEALKAYNNPAISFDGNDFMRICGHSTEMGCDIYTLWNPLTSTEDRYNLAKALAMVIDFKKKFAEKRVGALTIREFWYDSGEDLTEGHAIARIAAAVAKGNS